jgi:hypothetical protein
MPDSVTHPICPNPLPLKGNYEALLLLHDAWRFGDVFLNTDEVIFETHTQLTNRVNARSA